MPTVSPAQERLMQAAAHNPGGFGGVSQKVGKEFVGDAAAGIMAVTPARQALFLRRGPASDHPGEWCFPGGMIEAGETPEQAARREFAEETGALLGEELDILGDVDGDVNYRTFRSEQPGTFEPELDEENTEFIWASLDDPPKPLHPGVQVVLEKFAMDAGLAFDRSIMAGGRTGLAFAFDKESVRRVDPDGHLHVAVSNISKACVNPYLGHEIPGYRELGLDADKVYKLFRDPDELAKSAPTFNNKPLLSKHVATTADSYDPSIVIGSTGTDADFSAPYLRNSLVIWPKGGISAVESGDQRELSSAYRYRADMTPGVFEGEKYDGVMRDIVCNHVAIVKEGRAGADVVVGDSNEELLKMSKKVLLSRTALLTLGTLAAATAPLLATDHKLPDLVPIVADVTAKNFKDSKPAIIAALTKALEGKLAKDASIDEVAKLLDVLDSHDVKADADPTGTEPNSGMIGIAPEEEEALDVDPMAAVKEYLKSKGVSDEIIAGCPAGGAQDEPPPFKGQPKVGGKMAGDADKDDDKDDKDKKDDKVDKPAMDAAIAAAVTKAQKDAALVRDAERAVRPYVGELAVAYDSADKVYGAALKMLGVEVKDVHPSAYPTILGMQRKPGEKEVRPKIAADQAAAKDFATRWPNAERIQSA